MAKTASPRATSALTHLANEHKVVSRLLDQLDGAQTPERRQRLYADVRRAITTHARVEEEILYPAFRDAARTKSDRKLFFEATEEHHLVDGVIKELDDGDPATAEYAAKAKVLKDLVEHHAGEEEEEMFPRARKLLSAQQLDALGARIQARERELSGQPQEPRSVRAGQAPAAKGRATYGEISDASRGP
jgi:hemerythrin superfamily protein